MTNFKHTLTSLASAVIITAIEPINIKRWTRSLPFGLTFQGILGGFFMLAAPYTIATTNIDAEYRCTGADESQIRSENIRVARWFFAAAGMFILGFRLVVV